MSPLRHAYRFEPRPGTSATRAAVRKPDPRRFPPRPAATGPARGCRRRRSPRSAADPPGGARGDWARTWTLTWTRAVGSVRRAAAVRVVRRTWWRPPSGNAGHGVAVGAVAPDLVTAWVCTTTSARPSVMRWETTPVTPAWPTLSTGTALAALTFTTQTDRAAANGLARDGDQRVALVGELQAARAAGRWRSRPARSWWPGWPPPGKSLSARATCR